MYDLIDKLNAYLNRNRLTARVMYAGVTKKTAAALVAQGGKLAAVNKKRSDAGLGKLEEYKNNQIARKSWDLTAGAVVFVGPGNSSRIVVPQHNLDEIKEIAEANGYKYDALNNDAHTSIYLVKPATDGE